MQSHLDFPKKHLYLFSIENSNVYVLVFVLTVSGAAARVGAAPAADVAAAGVRAALTPTNSNQQQE